MTQTVKAITIWQPYASLMIEQIKVWEFRSWALAGHLIGRTIALHAAARPVPVSLLIALERDLLAGELGVLRDGSVCRALDLLEALRRGERVLPLGAILGTVSFGPPVACDRQFGPAPAFDPHPAAVAWAVRNPIQFERPIPAKGKQGFWNWTPALDPSA